MKKLELDLRKVTNDGVRLSEFECRLCGTKFIVALKIKTIIIAGENTVFPIQHCVRCGSRTLKYLGRAKKTLIMFWRR